MRRNGASGRGAALGIAIAGALFSCACSRSRGRVIEVAAEESKPETLAAVDEVRVVKATDVSVPDEELWDQDGARVSLRALMKDKVVAVNFVFTSCTTICAPMTSIFRRLQEELGDAMGRDVHLISISLDPTVDTPERLAAYAGKFDRREGWSFLTGEHERVVRVLKALGGYAPVKEEHTPLTLIGRPEAGRWVRVYGIAAPDRLAEQIKTLLPRDVPALGR